MTGASPASQEGPAAIQIAVTASGNDIQQKSAITGPSQLAGPSQNAVTFTRICTRIPRKTIHTALLGISISYLIGSSSIGCELVVSTTKLSWEAVHGLYQPAQS